MKADPEMSISSRRDENSLYALTKKFIKLINESPENHINMTQAAEQLGVGKRRIYDITNVLEGLGMVSKWSVNSVKWIGTGMDDILGPEKADNPLGEMLGIPNEEDQRLDEEIEQLNKEIYDMSQDKTRLENAYITYDDLQNLRIFKNKSVFAIKAPNDTSMEYPRYHKGAYRLRILTDRGPITVYYVINDE